MKSLATRRAILAAFAAGTMASVCAVTLNAPQLLVHLDRDYLRISAPHLNFLTGKALERLKDGGSIAFIGQLTVSPSPNFVIADARSVARFALSYDIWEQKFSVTRIGDRPESRRSSASHLSAQATENWCLDNLIVERSVLPAERLFYVQLDLRAEDPRDTLGILGDPGINITRLIEIFSRPGKSAQPRWLLSSGPFRLADLVKGVHG
ncbi:MAG TPA: hypothetical protein VHB50_06660 [Bryobacteraceae bacterium]|nr:hypothetical protein [Bryobacteraceae bacterium]